MNARGYLFGLSALTAMAMAGSPAVRAADVEPKYKISVNPSTVEVQEQSGVTRMDLRDESGVVIIPRVIIRERGGIASTQPQAQVSVPEPQVTVVEPAPRITIERQPRVTVAPQRRITVTPAPEIYAYQEVQPRSPSPWYGVRYTDNWMYTLKPYSLTDDYRLYNKAPRGTAMQPEAQPQDVFGYIGEEETPEPGVSRTARQVTGVIREMKLAQPDPNGPPQVLMTIQTDEGIARQVQFSRAEARRLGLDLGQRIIAAGEPRIMDGASVLVASRVEGVAAQGPAVRPTTPVGNWYHGVVLNTQVLQPLGLPDRHLVATVSLDDGTTIPVDLGPADNLNASQIPPNTRVNLMARMTNVQGRPVLMADLLQMPDQNQTMQINRERQ